MHGLYFNKVVTKKEEEEEGRQGGRKIPAYLDLLKLKTIRVCI